RSDRSTSVQPVKRFSRFQVLSPWRRRTTLYMPVSSRRSRGSRRPVAGTGLIYLPAGRRAGPGPTFFRAHREPPARGRRLGEWKRRPVKTEADAEAGSRGGFAMLDSSGYSLWQEYKAGLSAGERARGLSDCPPRL